MLGLDARLDYESLDFAMEQIRTALDVPLTDHEVHVLGPYILHTAVFKDVGLVW